MRGYNGKQIKYRAKQIVLLAETAEGHLNHFLPRNKRHKGVIMDVEILSPQTHAILNRRLEFRKLPLPNFSIFFSPTLFKFPEIILSRRNYTIKINNVEHLSILAQAQKLAYKNID